MSLLWLDKFCGSIGSRGFCSTAPPPTPTLLYPQEMEAVRCMAACWARDAVALAESEGNFRLTPRAAILDTARAAGVSPEFCRSFLKKLDPEGLL